MAEKIQFFGKFQIPEEEKEEYAEKLKLLLRTTGQLCLSKITTKDGEVCFLSEPEAYGSPYYNYSYFDKVCCYSNPQIVPETLEQKPGDTPYLHLYKSAYAVYYLEECCSQSPCMVSVGAKASVVLDTISLFNTMFPELSKKSGERFDLLKVYDVMKKDYPKANYGKKVTYKSLMEAIPLNPSVFLSSLLDVVDEIAEEEGLTALNAFFSEGHPEAFNYPEMEKRIRNDLNGYWIESSESDEEQIEAIFKPVITGKSLLFPAEAKNEKLEKIHSEMSLFPLKTFIRIVSDEYLTDYGELCGRYYRKERDCCFYKDSGLKEKDIPLNKKITLSEYLGVDDDELIYLWDEDSDIVFSEELKEWFKKIKKEYAEILKETEDGDFTHEMCETFRSIRENFLLYPFEDTYREFSEKHSKEYYAMIKLLERKSEKGYSGGEKEYNKRYDEIRKLFALLYNKKLRKMVLGV